MFAGRSLEVGEGSIVGRETAILMVFFCLVAKECENCNRLMGDDKYFVP